MSGPDFIIGGAPKCGTTSLHMLLAAHPDIGIPEGELHYFDADDPLAHPDFFPEGVPGRLDPDSDPARAWYADRFAPFADKTLRGEDSTTYLLSELAPARIARRLPDARLIFMLRHPVARTWSQYWHAVRTARTTLPFERALVEDPFLLLGSSYATGLRRFREALGPGRVHVILFERFTADMQGELDRATDFLGAPRMAVPAGGGWSNRTRYPAWPRAQRALNQVGGRVGAWRYRRHMGGPRTLSERLRARAHVEWFRRVQPLIPPAEKAPRMDAGTRLWLEAQLSARNAGLSELAGEDLSALWPGMRL